MKIHKYTINNSELFKMPSEERLIFYYIGIMLHEIFMLHKITLCSASSNEIEEKIGCITVQQIYFVCLLAGKLNECNVFISKKFFGNGLAKFYDNTAFLGNEGKNAINEIKKYFKNDNLITNTRKKFSFHYDPDYIAKTIEDNLLELNFDMYLSDFQGTCFYKGLSLIFIESLFSSINKVDQASAIKQYFEEIESISKSFIAFFNSLIIGLAKKYFNINEFIPETFEVDSPKYSDIRIPFFLTN